MNSIITSICTILTVTTIITISCVHGLPGAKIKFEPRVIEGMQYLGSDRAGATYFYLTDELHDGDQANKICVAQATDGLSIENASKNVELYRFLSSKRVTSVWTSGHDFLSNGNFIWSSTGQPFTYTHWLNDTPPSVPDCSCVSVTSQSSLCPINCVGDYRWVEEACSIKKRVVCQTTTTI